MADQLLSTSLRHRILAEVVEATGRGPSEFRWVDKSYRDALCHRDSGFYLSVDKNDGILWTPGANAINGSAGAGEEAAIMECARVWATALRRELESVAFLQRIEEN